VTEEFGGELPCDESVMRSFAGVGVKCANLALGIACTQHGRAAGAVGGAGDGAAEDGATPSRFIAVDIHVHRIVNRWGLVSAPTPEKTMVALERVLPPQCDVEINALLVPFGKHICTGVRPKCSTCPVRAGCRQVGVTSHR
jgi:endonuclease-3